MSNYSCLTMKGTVTVTATDVRTEEIVKQETVNNTIVRTGRVAIAKLVTGAVSEDRSYVVLGSDSFLLPRTYYPSTDVSSGWLGLLVDGEPALFFIGPLYTSNVASNTTVGPITRDVYGFATYLNQLFYAYDSYTGRNDIPVYQANGEIATYIPRVPKIKASVVVIDTIPRVKIAKVDPGLGSVTPYSTVSGGLWTRFYTDDTLFGPDHIEHVASEISTGSSDYVVAGLQLGVSNGITNIMDNAFVPGTYTSDVYVPTVSYGQTDTDRLFDTQAIFTTVIPASEGNGELGLGVTYTEAALLCRDSSWFTHAIFGSFYKNSNIRLTIRWVVDFLPQ